MRLRNSLSKTRSLELSLQIPESWEGLHPDELLARVAELKAAVGWLEHHRLTTETRAERSRRLKNARNKRYYDRTGKAVAAARRARLQDASETASENPQCRTRPQENRGFNAPENLPTASDKVSPTSPALSPPNPAINITSEPSLPGACAESAHEKNLNKPTAKSNPWVKLSIKIMLLYEDLGHLPPDLEQLTIWEAEGYDPDRCWSYLAGEMRTSLSDGVKPLKYFDKGLAQFMTRLGQSPTVDGQPNGAPIVVAKHRRGEPSPAEYRQAFERVKIQGPRWWGPRFGPYPDKPGYRGPAVLVDEWREYKAQQLARWRAGD